MRVAILLTLVTVAATTGCARRETATPTPEAPASSPPAATTEPTPIAPADEATAGAAGVAAAPADDGNGCNAEPVQRLVGDIYTPELGEEARVEAGARVERALRPGQIVTMEFLSDRLSFTLDESGRISAANCG